MKKLILSLIIIFSANLHSQEPALDSIALAEVTVSSKVIDVAKERETPIAFSTVTGAEIEIKGGNLEIPEFLKRTPGVYTSPTSGGGYGDGALRLRGFGMTNVAVVINGQPVNDMENGWVYWSNWAGLSDLTSSIQIQRGLGSTSLATPSAGGTISVNTRAAELEPGSSVKLLQGNDGYQKISVSHNTGVNDLGWSSSYLLSLWEGDGWRNGTAGAGLTYAFSVGYTPRGGDHEFNLSVIGAGQWHHQAYYTPWLEDYLDHGPIQGDDFRKYNQVYGEYKGEEFSFLRNYYNKPLATLNWDWEISSNVTLATSLYASAGRGGGTGDRGRNYDVTSYRRSMTDHLADGGDAFRRSDMTVNWDAVVSQNVNNAYIPSEGPFAGMKLGYHNDTDGETPSRWAVASKVRRFGTNSHNWVGGISKLKLDSENFRYELGIDLRSYKAYHRRGISDFLGLDGYISTINDYVFSGNFDRVGHVVTTAYESTPFNNLGMDDPNGTQRYYIGYNNWTGVNGLVEYVGSENFSAVLQAGTTTSRMWLEHFYTAPPETKSEVVRKNGNYLKAGANYNISEKSNVYANVGKIKKSPLVDDIFINGDYDYQQAENQDGQEITSFELGYGFLSSNVKLNLNAYSTVWGNRVLSRFSGSGEDAVRFVYEGVEQTHQGIEAELTWYPTSQLKIRGMASLGDHKYTKNFIGQGFDADNNQPNGQTATLYMDGVKIGNHAQTILYLGADYRFSYNFSVDLDFQSFDNLYGNFGPLDSEFSSANNRGSLQLPSFSIVDIGATYRTRFLGMNTRVRANVNNLFDEEYIADSSTNFFADGGRTWNGVNTTNIVNFGRGTSWNLGVTFDF